MTHTGGVDIVYLWVNGSDPVWRKKRQLARHELKSTQEQTAATYGNVEGRFRDNDELRYSLRALERFFPEHGNVYIVTDGQTPTWLRQHPKLRVVDHRALIPSERLPTFDSGNIETYIHRIPGLSERYFYLNDDMFFGAPVQLADWFWAEGFFACWSAEPQVRKGPPSADADALENACRMSVAWLDAHPRQMSQPGYSHTYRTFAHSPRPMFKSIMQSLEEIAPDLFAQARSTTFRCWDHPPIVSDFVIRWALANGRARVRDFSHVYVSSGAQCQESRMDKVLEQVGSLHFFCINDTLDDAPSDDPKLLQSRQALQSIFSQQSRYD